MRDLGRRSFLLAAAASAAAGRPARTKDGWPARAITFVPFPPGGIKAAIRTIGRVQG
jgi:hypothetical protein